MSREQKGRELALVRRAGGSAQHTERLNEHNAGLDDWYARCRRCGERLRGKLSTLREHRCHGA